MAFFQTIKRRLARRPHTNPNLPPRDLDKEATQLLDRVNIMRVFDFEGLCEAIAEMRENLKTKYFDRQDEAEQQRSADESATIDLPSLPPRGTVPDSQLIEDEDEMLFDTQTDTGQPRAPAKHHHHHPSESQDPIRHTSDVSRNEEVVAPESTDDGAPDPSLLMINSLTPLITPIQRNNYTQAQALLTTFMRSLHHLTTNHNLCTIILNDVVDSASHNHRSKTSDARRLTKTSPRQMGPAADDDDKTVSGSADHVSIFSSCTLRPALGKTLGYLVDVNVLVHAVPKTANDARTVYGDLGQSTRSVRKEKQHKKVEWVNIVEVLSDSLEGRTGRFDVFAVSPKGELVDVV